jgi:hypothetical protein
MVKAKTKTLPLSAVGLDGHNMDGRLGMDAPSTRTTDRTKRSLMESSRFSPGKDGLGVDMTELRNRVEDPQQFTDADRAAVDVLAGRLARVHSLGGDFLRVGFSTEIENIRHTAMA